MIEPTQIALVRRRLGLSQSDLARRSGVSQSLITKIETGIIDPSYSKLKAISQVLEAPSDSPKSNAVEIMNRHLLKIDASETVARAIEIMCLNGNGQLLVFTENNLTGTVSESSLLDFVVHQRENSDSLQTLVREVMSEPLPRVPPETDIEALVSLLNHFPAILVSTNGLIKGIITKLDLLSNIKLRTSFSVLSKLDASKHPAPA